MNPSEKEKIFNSIKQYSSTRMDCIKKVSFDNPHALNNDDYQGEEIDDNDNFTVWFNDKLNNSLLEDDGIQAMINDIAAPFLIELNDDNLKKIALQFKERFYKYATAIFMY